MSSSPCCTRPNVSSSTRAGTGDPLFPRPVLDPDLAGDRAAGEAGGAVQPGGLVDSAGLAEHRGAPVGGLRSMLQITDRSHRSFPVRVRGPLAGEPAAQVRDGRAIVGVAAEHLRHQEGPRAR
ncbi:MAG TPA: hypothetical protein VF060_06010 [Trebonia sp.]